MQALRVLVLGDSGVGKSSLLRVLSSDVKPGNGGVDKSGVAGVAPTIGCRTQVRIIRDMTPDPICLELLEVGGAAKYSKYRDFFFSFDIDAVFLLYDVSNRRQRRGIVHWENLISDKLGRDVPVLKIANKNDSGGLVDDGVGFSCLNNRSDARVIDEFVVNTALNHSQKNSSHNSQRPAIARRPSAKKFWMPTSDNQLPV